MKQFICIIISAILLVSCASNTEIQEDGAVSPQQLFEHGMMMQKKGQYQEASQKFEQLQREYPTHILALNAHVQKAYVLHLAGQFEAAIDAIESFLQQHPADNFAPYMMYLRALCYYDQILDVGRDQDLSIKSQDAFNSLINRFPNTKYAKDALLKLEYIHNLLAGKEMDIARFYLKKQEFIASINRLNNIVKKYQNTIFIQEALYRLTEIYYILVDLKNAKANELILSYNYPNNIWAIKAKQVLDGKRDEELNKPWYKKIQKELW